MLEMYCSAKGWTFSVTKDLGSGINYNKRGLKQIFEQIMKGQIGRLVLTHKDRLLRFGAELVFSLCAVATSYEQPISDWSLETDPILGSSQIGKNLSRI